MSIEPRVPEKKKYGEIGPGTCFRFRKRFSNGKKKWWYFVRTVSRTWCINLTRMGPSTFTDDVEMEIVSLDEAVNQRITFEELREDDGEDDGTGDSGVEAVVPASVGCEEQGGSGA